MSTEEQVKQVCARLKAIREEHKLSQLDLSLTSGVSQNMIAYIESGKRTPTLSTFLKLCNALKINPAVLFKTSEKEIADIRKQMHEYIDRFVR